MKITVLKSTVETALAPILKMVASVKLTIDYQPALTFQSDRQSLAIGCTLNEQELSMVLPDAVFDMRDTAFDVNLEMFNRLLGTANGTRISIERDVAHVVLSCDERFIGQLAPMDSRSDAKFQIPKEADSTVLPTNFANFILQAFSCAGSDDRYSSMTGVNVSSRGIAGSDGKQLFHLPLPLRLDERVTMPPSKVYAALKNLRWTSLAHWKTKGDEQMFAISGDGFRYTAKAVEGLYPEYWNIIPAEQRNDVTFTLTPDGARSLSAFLNEDKNDAFVELTVHPEKIELKHDDDTTRKGTFTAISRSTNLPCKASVNTRYLRQFLKMGFMSMSLSSKSPNAIVSIGGTGKYLFMPCREPHGNTAAEPATPSNTKPETRPPKVSINSTTNTNPTIDNNQTNKEKTTMTQTITTPTAIRPTAAFNAPAPTVNPTTVPVNPLEETLSSIAAMREQLTNLETRLLEAGRRLKAALIEQKQKDRMYADATKKLEKIRLAV